MKRLCVLLLAAAAAFSQYKTQPGGDPPSEIAAQIAASLAKPGTKIVDAGGAVYAEIWLRSTMPSGPNTGEQSVTLPTIPPGSVLGVIRFATKTMDRRGQTVNPGVYTLRYGNYPVNGNHQGAAPQRDFLLLCSAALDKNIAAISDFDALLDLARKSGGAAHPSVLSFWKSDADQKAGFEKQGEHDWVLTTKIGDVAVSIILIGKVEE